MRIRIRIRIIEIPLGVEKEKKKEGKIKEGDQTLGSIHFQLSLQTHEHTTKVLITSKTLLLHE